MVRNLILVVLDATRKDVFDTYAQRLQDRADVAFTNCHSTAPFSVPSHASLFTGQIASEHDVHVFGPDYASVAPDDFLTTSLEHSAIIVTGNQWTDTSFGWDRFFDTHEYVHRDIIYPKVGRAENVSYLEFLTDAVGHDHPFKRFVNGAGWKLLQEFNQRSWPRPIDDGARRVVKRTLDHIRAADEPVIVFNNIMDVHRPLRRIPAFDDMLHEAGWFFDVHSVNPSKVMAENHPQTLADVSDDISVLRGLYDASVEYVDRVVAEYLDQIETMTGKETTVIVTADHGENLGYESERGHLFHTASMTEALLHVPMLVFNAPEAAPRGEVGGLVSHADLARLMYAITEDSWVDITSESIAAEKIGDTIDVDRYPWLKEIQEWWTRSIRRVYSDDGTAIEWDSTGDVFEWNVSVGASTESLVEELDAPPEWARDHFETDIWA
jgi:arylsulfatase A-like enzyme